MPNQDDEIHDRAASPQARERLSSDYEDEYRPRSRRRASAAPEAPPPVEDGPERTAPLSSILGQDPATRKLVISALGIVGLLLLAVGIWSLAGGRHEGVPLIAPPPWPVKARPADPGGMQIMSDDAATGDVTGQGEVHLAPAPEQPDAQALARRNAPLSDPNSSAQPAAPPSSAAPASQSSVPSEASPMRDGSAAAPTAAPPGPPPSQSAPRSDAGAGAASASAPAQAMRPKPASPSSAAARRHTPSDRSSALPPPVPLRENAPSSSARHAKGGQVQLAALGSEADARRAWAQIKEKAPSLLSGRQPLYQKVTRNGRLFVRLRLGGFADVKESRNFCAKLHAHAIACTPAQF